VSGVVSGGVGILYGALNASGRQKKWVRSSGSMSNCLDPRTMGPENTVKFFSVKHHVFQTVLKSEILEPLGRGSDLPSNHFEIQELIKWDGRRSFQQQSEGYIRLSLTTRVSGQGK